VGGTRGDVLALEFERKPSSACLKAPELCEAVDMAGMAKVGGANHLGSAIGRSKELAGMGDSATLTFWKTCPSAGTYAPELISKAWPELSYQ
jgi:hypothetical protein